MGIDFRFRDFAYPFSILRLKKVFDRNQWLDAEALSEYQAARLRQIITHAYDNVPYYQKLFRENDIGPGDIQTAKDLKNIPCLTKDQLRLNFNSLVARDAKKYRPTMLFTSGTTGGKISFYADKTSNVLEFVFGDGQDINSGIYSRPFLLKTLSITRRIRNSCIISIHLQDS
jgi:hypothetical protein